MFSVRVGALAFLQNSNPAETREKKKKEKLSQSLISVPLFVHIYELNVENQGLLLPWSS